MYHHSRRAQIKAIPVAAAAGGDLMRRRPEGDHPSPIICHISPINGHLSPSIYHHPCRAQIKESPVAAAAVGDLMSRRLKRITEEISYHLSSITYLPSPTIYHLSPSIYYHSRRAHIKASPVAAAAGGDLMRRRLKRITEEISTLSTSLPLSWESSVFVAVDEERMDVLRVELALCANQATRDISESVLTPVLGSAPNPHTAEVGLCARPGNALIESVLPRASAAPTLTIEEGFCDARQRVKIERIVYPQWRGQDTPQCEGCLLNLTHGVSAFGANPGNAFENLANRGAPQCEACAPPTLTELRVELALCAKPGNRVVFERIVLTPVAMHCLLNLTSKRVDMDRIVLPPCEAAAPGDPGPQSGERSEAFVYDTEAVLRWRALPPESHRVESGGRLVYDIPCDVFDIDATRATPPSGGRVVYERPRLLVDLSESVLSSSAEASASGPLKSHRVARVGACVRTPGDVLIVRRIGANPIARLWPLNITGRKAGHALIFEDRFYDQCADLPAPTPTERRALIIPSTDTPYSRGYFVFDIYLPPEYPNKPPKVQLLTTEGGRVRFNPNLYNSGKVCLSLLGTWEGPSWKPATSTLLQVLVSISAMILVPDPYFNEPSYEMSMNTAEGKENSRRYNEQVRADTLRVALLPFNGQGLRRMLSLLICQSWYPVQRATGAEVNAQAASLPGWDTFKEIIMHDLRAKQDLIKAQAQAWAEEAKQPQLKVPANKCRAHYSGPYSAPSAAEVATHAYGLTPYRVCRSLEDGCRIGYIPDLITRLFWARPTRDIGVMKCATPSSNKHHASQCDNGSLLCVASGAVRYDRMRGRQPSCASDVAESSDDRARDGGKPFEAIIHRDKKNPESPPPPPPTPPPLPPLAPPPVKTADAATIPTEDANEVGLTADEIAALRAAEASAKWQQLKQDISTHRVLMMERPSGYHPDNSRQIAGTFDLATRQWVHIESPDGLFCAGHTVTADGRVLVVGGHRDNAGWSSGLQSMRLLNEGTSNLDKIGIMAYPRWYPTATLLPNKKIMIMGGTQDVGAGTAVNPFYEIWDPDYQISKTVTKPVDPGLLNKVRQNYYPFNYVLPTGDLFTFCARYGKIMEPNAAVYLADLPRRPGFANAQFPFTGTSVILALLPENNYLVEVVVFGGANEGATNFLDRAAGSKSHRYISVLDFPLYDFGDGWSEEEMGSSRVMGDATILPNGNVIVLNGAQTGLAGDSANGGESRANHPNFHPVQYNPNNPKGVRYTELARSQVPRMYHSTAVLTTNGTILVAGCDRCNSLLIESDEAYIPAPVKAEYRMEIFYPPSWYDFDAKPKIVSAPTTITYGEKFLVAYAGELSEYGTVTRAVLVAPGATTHSFNTNQRVVGLVVNDNDEFGQVLTLVAPPNANIAPSQKFMLFLLNGDTYSRATWVHLA
eukprot:gene26984-8998_t